MIIGVVGFIGSGKDTAADYLVQNHNFVRESFAGTLKDAVAAVFGWDRELLEGKTDEARVWREQVDPWWSTRLGMPEFTPRLALQLWGTEVCRKAFHNDIWIASLQNKLRKTDTDIVISDVRFPNEIDTIRDLGGQVVWVQRGPLPVWYNLASHENHPQKFTEQLFCALKGDTMKQKYPDVHASEWSWAGAEFDHIIDNNGTLEELYAQVASVVGS